MAVELREGISLVWEGMYCNRAKVTISRAMVFLSSFVPVSEATY